MASVTRVTGAQVRQVEVWLRAKLASRWIERRRDSLLLAAIALAPVALWLAAGNPIDRFGSPSAALRQIALLAAHLGVTAFALNLLLGSRVGAAVRAFGGLPKVYKVHRLVGLSLPALLIVHGALMVASLSIYSPALGLVLLTPSAGWPVFFGSLAFVALVGLAPLPVLLKVKHETFARLHRFVGLTFLLASVHYLLVSGAKASSPLLTPYLIALTLAGAGAYLYRAVYVRYLAKRPSYRVDSATSLGPATAEITLAPRKAPATFRAGQFVFVTLRDRDLRKQAHPFVVRSAPRSSRPRLIVEALDDAVVALQRIEAGAEAKLEGPYEAFARRKGNNRRQVWVGGGIGVAPFLSMAHALEDSDYEVDFYYCTERAGDAHHLDEFFAIADRNPRFRVAPIRKESLGQITADDIAAASPDLTDEEILIAGPLPMLRNLRKQFVALGVPPARVHFEEFGAPAA